MSIKKDGTIRTCLREHIMKEMHVLIQGTNNQETEYENIL